MVSGRFSFLAALLIAAAAALAYANTFSVPFLFDDQASILGNPTILSLREAWSPPPDGGLTVSGRPLLNVTLGLNHALSGKEVWSYHLFNLLIHVAAGCTLFGIVRRTLVLMSCRSLLAGDSGRGESAGVAESPASRLLQEDIPWVALVVALVWTLHPLQTQSVTYIIQRAESLAGLLQLLVLWSFIRSVEPGAAPGWRLLTWVACLAGMATKETMVTAPVLVALYDRIFVAGSWREVWARRLRQHGELAATWVLLLWLVLGTGGRGSTAGFGSGMSVGDYALTQVGAVGHYLRLAFWPQPLVFDYGRELARGWGDVWLAALGVFPLLAASLWAAARGRVAGFLGVAFFVLLAPSSSFVPVTTQTMGEHRVYLPLAAVVTLVVGGLYARLGRRSLWVGAMLAAGLGMATIRRNHDYRSAQDLWEDTVAKRPDNPRALATLAGFYERADRLDDALPLFERAVALDPDYLEAQNNLGNILVDLGQPERALGCFRRALAGNPGQPTVLHNLGAALLQTGRMSEAIEAWEQALRVDPNQALTRSVLATALATQGRLAEATTHFADYLRVRPDDAAAHANLGSVLFALARSREAMAEFETALRLQPGNAALHNQFGEALARSGRVADALAQFQEALRLQPDFAGARENLERATRALGRK